MKNRTLSLAVVVVFIALAVGFQCWEPLTNAATRLNQQANVDFARVSLDERVEVSVPLELKGTPKGEAEGAVLQQIINELDIECLVTDIPKLIVHSVVDMEKDSVLAIKDLKLPPGVKCLQDEDLIVATVKEIQEVVVTPEIAEGTAAEPEVIGRKAEEEAAPAEGEAPAPAAKKEKEEKK